MLNPNPGLSYANPQPTYPNSYASMFMPLRVPYPQQQEQQEQQRKQPWSWLRNPLGKDNIGQTLGVLATLWGPQMHGGLGGLAINALTQKQQPGIQPNQYAPIAFRHPLYDEWEGA